MRARVQKLIHDLVRVSLAFRQLSHDLLTLIHAVTLVKFVIDGAGSHTRDHL